MHPKNCFPERPSGACNLKKENSTWGREFYNYCFQEINDFVISLTKPRIMYQIDCSKMALETVKGKGPESQSNHLHYNYNYNYNRTARAYPAKDIMVIRQEHIWDDMRSIEKFLGGDPRQHFENQGPIMRHGSDKFDYKAVVNPDLLPSLCCAIPNEYVGYIMRSAVFPTNLTMSAFSLFQSILVLLHS